MYEIEIKSLLRTEENANKLRDKLKAHKRELTHHGSHSQLNHYFVAPEDLNELEGALVPHVSEESRQKLRRILEEGEDHSVRTRNADGTILVVIKASIGDDTSANGVSRIEFEEEVDLNLEEIDDLLLDAGLEYQAKWSRDREEFSFGEDVSVTIDKNAGYGYLAELEKEVKNEDRVPMVEDQLRGLLNELGFEELSQDRLERMFDYYNENWQEYYGTDKTFVIE
jgi:adenylate cyclase class IV